MPGEGFSLALYLFTYCLYPQVVPGIVTAMENLQMSMTSSMATLQAKNSDEIQWSAPAAQEAVVDVRNEVARSGQNQKTLV